MNENLRSRKKSSGSSGQERKSSGSTRIVKNKCCLEKGEFLRWPPCANRRKEKLKCECAKAYRYHKWLHWYCLLSWRIKVLLCGWECTRVEKKNKTKQWTCGFVWYDVQHAQRTFYKVTQILDAVGQGSSQPIQASQYNNFVKNNGNYTQKWKLYTYKEL